MTKTNSASKRPKRIRRDRNRDKLRKKNLNVVGLFAGIGGFEVGLEAAGHSTILLCENDPAAKAVLKNRFPSVTLAGDIRKVRALPNSTDVVVAGFPCQNLSMAGDKTGISGSQSNLVRHVFRLLKTRKVPWVVLENVYFMLHLARGRAIKNIIGELEKLGYRWAYRVVNSYWFGVPQRRRRVFFVATLEGDPRNVLFADDAPLPKKCNPTIDKPIGFYWTEGRSGVGTAIDCIPPLKTASGLGIPSPPAVLFPDGMVAKPDIRDAERLQGFPANWTKAAEAISGRGARWRLVGNAVTIPVAKWIGKRLISPGTYDDSNDVKLGKNEPSPNAAWSIGNGWFKSNVTERPLKGKLPSLAKFRKFEWVPLSKRATAGFLRRAKEGNLKFPKGFLAALKKHLKSAE